MKKRFAIWGTGIVVKKAYRLLKEQENVQIVSFADKDKEKRNREVLGLPVKSPKELLEAVNNNEVDAVVLAFQNDFLKKPVLYLGIAEKSLSFT